MAVEIEDTHKDMFCSKVVTDVDSNISELERQLDRLEKQVIEVEEMKWEDIELILSGLSEDRDKQLYGRVCYYAAYYMLCAGRSEEVIQYLNESVRCLLGTNEVRELARCYNMLGIIAHSQNNLTLAMEQYEKALTYAGEYQDKAIYNGVLSNMAEAYYRLGVYEKAVSCYEECLGNYQDITPSYARAVINYRKALASYGYCLVRIEKVEEATAIADRILGMSCDRNCELATRLGTYTFLAFLYHKRKEPSREELATKVAVDVALNMEQVISEFDEVLNLVLFLSLTKRMSYLREILPSLEAKAVEEQNGGFLLQLLLIHMNDCSDDMEPDEFRRNAQSFLQVKQECDKIENAQSIRLLELRNRIYQMEEEQKVLEETNSKL